MAIAVRNVTSHVRVIERITHAPRALPQQEQPIAANDLDDVEYSRAIPLDTPIAKSPSRPPRQ
jgi:hypothetical protein